MKYNLDILHSVKQGRRSGKTVSAIMDAIGTIMVTENEKIPFIISRMNRVADIKPIFHDICVSHFNEEPIFYDMFTFGIKGYSSTLHFIGLEQSREKLKGFKMIPIDDLG